MRLCRNCDMSISWDKRRDYDPSPVCRTILRSSFILSSFIFNYLYLSRRISNFFYYSLRFRINSTSTAFILSCQFFSPSFLSASNFLISLYMLYIICSVIRASLGFLLFAFYFSLFRVSFCYISLKFYLLATCASCNLRSTF